MSAPSAHRSAAKAEEGSPVRPSSAEIDWSAFGPRERNLLLLGDWEHDNSQVVCTPAGHVTFSTKCADREYAHVGIGFTAALVAAAHREWTKETTP